MAFLEHQQLQPEDLLRFITQQQEQIIQLKEQIELLEAEIRRLKKLPAKPDIKPNTKPPDDDTGSPDGDPSAPEGNDGASPDTSSKQKVKKPNEKTRKQRKQPRKPSAEKSIPIAATDVPEGSIRNGTTPFHVQELTIQTSSIEYLLEQWVTPDGQTITAKPPASLHGHHYGPMLQAYVLHQYHGCSVTQPELLDWLWDIGISISSGELSQLLTKGHEQFHAEKDELLTTGIRCSSYIQTDDTGTRHKGKNGYCTIINNESFAWFESTDSKSRENFVSLLHRPWSTYTFTDDALIYLENWITQKVATRS
ncbi:transposase [Endozoicomonas sp. SCSIO W0465]|uniref:transposase n=1 Tax=Endozoicomonas sp. SCSIO W0465 TaxID=2918516 RepID=UPI002076541E|nr:transposase [Endozoicomonas sp. SCSIO W0465]USE36346.1 transposase [Endozoicomonas sp. SCSIO W0465]